MINHVREKKKETCFAHHHLIVSVYLSFLTQHTYSTLSLICLDFPSQMFSSGNGSVLFFGSSCGWCEPSKPATLLRCPCLSLSGLPTPPPIHGVLSEGQFLWTQTTVPLVLPGLEMHSAILSCLSASPTGCQTCGLYSYASSSFSFSFLHSEFLTVPMSKLVVEGLRKDYLCGWWYWAYYIALGQNYLLFLNCCTAFSFII